MSIVPSQEDEAQEVKSRVSTGVPALDDLLDGGFPGGKSYLIAGEPGSGKTIFCMLFALRSLMDRQRVVYVPMDEKPSEVVENAASLGLDLRKYVESAQLFMLSFGSASSQRDVDAAKVASDLASYITRSGATRLIIDPLGPLTGKGSGEQAQAVIRALQNRLKTTNLLTLNCSSQNDGGAEWKDYPVHGVVQIGFRRKQRSLVRTILVSKMRATPLDLKEREFAIVNERGIVIEETGPKPVVSRPVAFKAPELSQPSPWDA